MATAPFDTLRLATELEAGGFSSEQARTPSAALANAMSGANLAPKQDLRDTEQRLTIRLGGIAAAVAAALFAALHLFPPPH